MAPRWRIRLWSLALWIGLASTVLSLALTTVSCVWVVEYASGRWSVSAFRGAVRVKVAEFPKDPDDEGFDSLEIDPDHRKPQWWLEDKGKSQLNAGLVAYESLDLAAVPWYKHVTVLIWPLVAVSLAFTFIAWRFRRRAVAQGVGKCASCGYLLAGLAAGAACPECGSVGGTTADV